MQVKDFLTDTGKWQCIECGACCKLMHNVPELCFLDRGDDICMHLGSDDRCRIYKTRPNKCRVSVAYGDDFDPLERARWCYGVLAVVDSLRGSIVSQPMGGGGR